MGEDTDLGVMVKGLSVCFLVFFKFLSICVDEESSRRGNRVVSECAVRTRVIVL